MKGLMFSNMTEYPSGLFLIFQHPYRVEGSFRGVPVISKQLSLEYIHQLPLRRLREHRWWASWKHVSDGWMQGCTLDLNSPTLWLPAQNLHKSKSVTKSNIEGWRGGLGCWGRKRKSPLGWSRWPLTVPHVPVDDPTHICAYKCYRVAEGTWGLERNRRYLGGERWRYYRYNQDTLCTCVI